MVKVFFSFLNDFWPTNTKSIIAKWSIWIILQKYG